VETGADASDRRGVRFEAYAPSATSKRGPVLGFEVMARLPPDPIAWRAGT